MDYASLSKTIPLTLSTSLSLLIMGLPFLSFVLLLLIGRGKETLAWLGTGIQLAAAVVAAVVFYLAWDENPVQARTIWFQVSTQSFEYSFTVGLLVDKLAALLMLVVTIVSTLVHLYSIAYMRAERHFTRYFAYLGLFTFAMLGVILMDNLLMIFIFWELVGVSSYSLITFWNERPAALRAGSKAFIINRIGDAGFLVGIMVLWSQFGTLDLLMLEKLMRQSVLTDNGYWLSAFRIGGQVFENSAPAHWLTIAGLGLFCGSVGKPAQFPLQTWLPDAMHGPTPASALIHAATMVAAGVYLLARVFVLLNGDVLNIIAFTGALTAFMGAVAALTQNDIKRVLAYSTVSQLGYMVMGMGVGAYDASVFHLVTHAAFKACLFLGAGSVIHALHRMQASKAHFDAQDMRCMGGLRSKMPVTFATYLVASLSLAGIPLFSGFLSKDAILTGTLSWLAAMSNMEPNVYLIVPVLAFLTTLLTAFYMGRQVLLVFFGKFRGNQNTDHTGAGYDRIKESPVLMTIPLLVLAALSTGFIFSLNPLQGDMSWILSRLTVPTLATPVDFRFYSELVLLSDRWHSTASGLATGLAVTGLLLAYSVYRPNGRFVRAYYKSGQSNNFIRNISYHNWYLDRIHYYLFTRPTLKLAAIIHLFDRKVIDATVNLAGVTQVVLSHLTAWADRYLIDGIVRSITWLASFVGRMVRPVAGGRIQTYFVLTLVVFLFFVYWLAI